MIHKLSYKVEIYLAIVPIYLNRLDIDSPSDGYV